MAESELAARRASSSGALGLERAKSLALGDAKDEHLRLLATAQAAGAAGEHDLALDALDRASHLFPDGEACARAGTRESQG